MNEKMKKQEHEANNLAKDLKKQLDIMDKNMKTQETKNREVILQKDKLSETSKRKAEINCLRQRAKDLQRGSKEKHGYKKHTDNSR